MSWLLPCLALIVIGLVVWAILLRYQANMSLFLAGLALNGLALAFGKNILPESASTGLVFLEPFELLKAVSIKQLMGVGFITLAAGGFADYMQAIGASRIFVSLMGWGLRHIRDPYLILGATFVLGNALCFVIPSASGLAMLMIVTTYPLLTSLGCSRLASAAVIASPMAIAYAPASSMANMAAQIAHLEPMQYLIHEQIPIALPMILSMAAAHVFYQRHCDNASGEDCANQERIVPPDSIPPLLHIYAILPATPLFFMVALNKYVTDWSALSVATAMFCAWTVSFVIDLCLRGNPRESFTRSFAMFEGMGKILTSTVGLIFVAAFFAVGMQNCGVIDYAIALVIEHELGLHGISVLLSCAVGFITILTGSGVAAFSTLVQLVPELASKVGLDTVSTILMMNTTSEIMRAVSPIAGVVIIVSGFAGVNPFSVVRRTAIPCFVGFVAMLTTVALRIGSI